MPRTSAGIEGGEGWPRNGARLPKENPLMLGWTVTFLVIALIAFLLGFGVIGSAFMGIAKILFFVFIILFVISLIMGRRRPVA